MINIANHVRHLTWKSVVKSLKCAYNIGRKLVFLMRTQKSVKLLTTSMNDDFKYNFKVLILLFK